MSAPAPLAAPAAGEEAPQKKRRRLFGRRTRGEEAAQQQETGRKWLQWRRTPRQTRPRPRTRRSSPSIAFYLTIFALITGALAVALICRPDLIPGLAPSQADTVEPAEPAQSGPTPEQLERAVELARQQAELAALQGQLAVREAELAEKEAQVEQALQGLNGNGRREANLTRTARLLTEMPPFSAAPLLAELDDGTAVAVLRHMTADEAAPILAAMEAGRAAELLEAYAEEAEP